MSNHRPRQSWLTPASSLWVRMQTRVVHGQLLIPLTFTSEYAPESKFRAAVAMKEELLKNAVISYLGTASDFTEADFTLVISPSITTPKHEERPTRFIGEFSLGGRVGVPVLTQFSYTATVPTIGDAIEALDEFCRDLAHVLLRIVDISAELASKDHIRVDNIEEVRIRCIYIQCNVASRARCFIDRAYLGPRTAREPRHAATPESCRPRARVLAHRCKATCTDRPR